MAMLARIRSTVVLTLVSILSSFSVLPAWSQTGLQTQDVALRPPANLETDLPPGYSVPIVDLSGESERQVVVDREPGQYLGRPTTVLLEDGRTLLTVYPKGHGRGGIVYREGQDCACPGLELLPDGTFVTTTYGHWIEGEEPYVVSVRFRMEELDAKATELVQE